MLNFHKLIALSLSALLVACGGGGGNPGSSSGTGGSGAVLASADPVIKSAALIDASGASTNSIGATGYTLLKVTLVNPKGGAIQNQVIDVSGDQAKVIFPEGPSGLTDSAGVATIKVARASLVATGAGSLTITYSYKVGSLTYIYPDGIKPPTADKVISTYLGYQLSAANVTLTNLDVGTTALPAYGTRQLSVQANINGTAATTPVQVSFIASCGQISPATASSNSNGVISVSYTATDAAGTAQSTQGCSGKAVEISASTIGAAIATKTLNIEAAPATNMSFVDASPARIYLANSGGPTQSVVQFKLLNARGEALLGRSVTLSLKTLNGGIPKATFGTVGNTNPIAAVTDAEGKVSVPVFSGTVPTNVLVNAALASDPLVQSDSAVLTIASGRAAQARASLALKELSIEGLGRDGVETDVTMSLADRQGNPVPDGTAVNFVTEGGVMIPPVCTTGVVPGDSRCTVKIRSQNPRPAGGRVSILAYVAGEEDFVDANFNNVYDCGESFTDLGTAYRDDNENGIFDTGEFSVPRSASTSACSAGAAPAPQLGDRVWGSVDVRQRATIIFASSGANIAGSITGNTLSVVISDLNGNSIPTGSTVAATTTTISCGLDNTISTILRKIPNSLGPFATSYTISAGCVAGDVINVEVTTPPPSPSIPGTVTTKTFVVP